LKELLQKAIDHALARGATYAEARFVASSYQEVSTRNLTPQDLSSDYSAGMGIRVLLDGAWGFACSRTMENDAVSGAAARAVEIARASARVQREPISLDPIAATVDSFETPVERDPWQVSLGEKLDLLFAAEEQIRQGGRVSVSSGHMIFQREHKQFVNSEGTDVTQTLVRSLGGIQAIAVADGRAQIRSYPSNHGSGGAAGYEAVEALQLPAHGERIAREAVALLSAKPCPTGAMTVVLDGTLVALQLHESCGHPIELDRVLGSEISHYGSSFLTVDKLDRFRYGSELVTIVTDPTLTHGLGGFAYDDEGVPAQRSTLVDHGILVNYLTSRETAPVIGKSSNGSARASGWQVPPIVRMTNLNLEAGEGALEDLIAGVDHGIYMEVPKSWSIDDRRVNFQFGAEIGWEITGGRLGDMVQNPTYMGISPKFWNNCDGIAGPSAWHLWGLAGCGKGQPAQTVCVGHGSAPARFRDVYVGVRR
jgi:TldD protein